MRAFVGGALEVFDEIEDELRTMALLMFGAAEVLGRRASPSEKMQRCLRIASKSLCGFPGQIDNLTRGRAVAHYSRVDVE
jgi:hypothetical protein